MLGDAGGNQVIALASGFYVQSGFFHHFVFFYNQVHVIGQCFDFDLEGAVRLL